MPHRGNAKIIATLRALENQNVVVAVEPEKPVSVYGALVPAEFRSQAAWHVHDAHGAFLIRVGNILSIEGIVIVVKAFERASGDELRTASDEKSSPAPAQHSTHRVQYMGDGRHINEGGPTAREVV